MVTVTKNMMDLRSSFFIFSCIVGVKEYFYICIFYSLAIGEKHEFSFEWMERKFVHTKKFDHFAKLNINKGNKLMNIFVAMH